MKMKKMMATLMMGVMITMAMVAPGMAMANEPTAPTQAPAAATDPATKYGMPYNTEDGVMMVPLAWVAAAQTGQDKAVVERGADGSYIVFATKRTPEVKDMFGDVVTKAKTSERITVFNPGEANMIVFGMKIGMPAPAQEVEGKFFVPVQSAILACVIR